jgi:hypothetical protein
MSKASNMYDQSLNKHRLSVVLLPLIILQVMTTLGAVLHQPWFFWLGAVVSGVTILAYAFIKNDALFKRLFLYGIIFGTIELWSDAYYILIGAIEYKHFGLFRLLKSPDYMALAWSIYCVVFGYLGILLDKWKRKLWLLVVCALALGVVIPPYNESMAYYAHAWEYLGSPSWLHTPYWIWVLFPVIIVGMVLPVVLLYRRKTEHILEWIGGAALGAIWLLISSQITYHLLG